MKKSVAIQTLKLTNNYGGILQAYALQKYLEELGHEPVHLNRVRNQSILLKIKLFIRRYLKFSRIQALKKVQRKYADFISKNVKLSPELQSYTEWNNYIETKAFDLVITGSDQVWRFDYIHGLEREMFLDIEDETIKKSSYAASFGKNDLNEINGLDITRFLSSFQKVSVREKSSVGFLKDKFNITSDYHIDPTLLLPKEKYIELFDLHSLNENTILAYILDKEKNKLDIIKFAEKELNLPSKIVFGSFGTNLEVEDILAKPSIKEWVQNFKSSRTVITDSFHGMIFSIIFEKQFLVIANEGRGIDRFASFLDLMDLNDRLVFSKDGVTPEILNARIDYDRVNDIIKKEIERSKYYLADLLKTK